MLTVETKSYQEIGDYIKNYDYNKIFSNTMFQSFYQSLDGYQAINIKAATFYKNFPKY